MALGTTRQLLCDLEAVQNRASRIRVLRDGLGLPKRSWP